MAQVQMPTGEIVEMPDNPTPDQLAQLALIHSPSGVTNADVPSVVPGGTPSGSPAQSMWDRVKPYITSGDPIADLKHGVSLAARAAIQGATGTTGMVADLPFQIANLFGANQQLPTQGQNNILDQALGTPRDIGEKALLFGGTMAAGGAMDPAMLAAQAAIPKALYKAPPQLTGPALNAQTINNGMNAGLKVTPSTSPGAGIGSQALEALAGKSALNTNMQNQNRSVIDRLANGIVGNPANAALDDSALNQAIGSTYANGYDPIRAIPKLTTGSVYRKTLDQISQQAPALSDVVDAYRTPSMSGAQAIDWIKTLRQRAADAYASNSPDKGMLGSTYTGIANALEHNTGLNLPAGSDLLGNYQAARTQIAQQYAVKKAIVDGTGSINAANIGAQLAKGSQFGGVSPFTGNLAMIGNMAKAAPTVTRFPTAPSSPLTKFDTGLLTGGGGALLSGNLPTAAGLLAAGAARPALRALLLSPTYQNMFLRPSIGQGAIQQFLQNPALQNGIPAAMQGLFGQQQK